MDIKHARRRTFDIEYVVVTEDNLAEVAEWSGGVVGGEGKDRFVRIVDKNAMNSRQNKAFIDDHMVHHLELKTFKAFSPKAFKKAFEEQHVSHTQEDDRSSVSGRFVSAEEAAANPKETVHETRTVELPRDADPS